MANGQGTTDYGGMACQKINFTFTWIWAKASPWYAKTCRLTHKRCRPHIPRTYPTLNMFNHMSLSFGSPFLCGFIVSSVLLWSLPCTHIRIHIYLHIRLMGSKLVNNSNGRKQPPANSFFSDPGGAFAQFNSSTTLLKFVGLPHFVTIYTPMVDAT